MSISVGLLDRLITLSRRSRCDISDRFAWPAAVSTRKLWCDEELLSTFGTGAHDRLTRDDLAALSKWEAVNFFSLNVYGIKDAMAFLCKKMYEDRYIPTREYMHIFLAEENDHLWFFAKFCIDYVGKIYSSRWPRTEETTSDLEEDFLMFSSILIFEEFVDFYNKRVGDNLEVEPILRDINYQHHIDESRHVSFGREVVRALFADIMESSTNPDATRAALEKKIINRFTYFITMMYNPSTYEDSQVYTRAGFQSAFQMRNELRNAPERRQHHHRWFQRTAEFFRRTGVVRDTGFLLSC
ncbi:hypothetical protein D3093_34160 (plasmid) [Azospirillum argentinense]|uniref:AurF domain containing protein n=1 Tax=Azospirillum argentinense TaxID=2970906 RepID=A0A4D8PU05_9PROT|nr:diiron oxygenase [Azospirillum argentinense]QCO00278.1 hypothetical protein D3093_34160 [Azospirillum argentinense]